MAWSAQQLRQGLGLADIAAMARSAQSDPKGCRGAVPMIVARRAELAEESAVTVATIASATPELVARLGGRPGAGHHRRAWDAAVGAVGA